MSILNIGRVIDESKKLMSDIDVENYLVSEILSSAISSHEAGLIYKIVRRNPPNERQVQRFETVERDHTNG